ncbi:subtilase [Plectosphaerella plurivora]|uniref:Subtilase n=1 Tax=Plectosphaerella plurivora TaxID=936078 RepID=A0A9P8VF66_9PEZI|nr:subtilase [Plectosphaerella plurivora]
MHIRQILALLPLAGGSLAQHRSPANADQGTIIPGKFVVEYAHTAALRKRQDELAQRPDVNVVASFDSDIFAGVSVETDDLDAETLQSFADVVNVWPSRRYPMPSFGTNEVAESLDGAADMAVHKVTGVDKLHQLGIFGKGAKIGVIDTGIDYNHTAFGSSFGPGARVVGGYDFVGEEYPVGGAVPDDDPIDNLGHGSHVAGIAAGKTANFTGVAPEATLYAYKVLGNGDGVEDEIIIQALLRAIDDEVDIVTCSLGGPNGWADGSWGAVASRLVDEGIVVTAVAANDGGVGPFWASTGSGRHVLNVGSADTDAELDTVIKPSNFTQWGGLYDLEPKPNIVAPGRNILSVSIRAPDAFVVESGTSMATPYVAGIAALWIGKNGGRSVHGKGFARKLQQRIISSGESLPWTDSEGVRSSDPSWRAPPAQVGGGLVNAWKVLEYTSHLEFDTIVLNDTRNFNPAHDISVFNEGNETVTYTFEVENWAGLEMLGWVDGWRGWTRRIRNTSSLYPVKLEPGVVVPDSFTLGPGESKTLSVTFENPSNLGWNSSALPIYGGSVIVSSDLGEKLSVPFMGLGADLRQELNDISGPTYPFHNTGADLVPWPSQAVFSLNLSLAVQDYPKINNMLIWGTREIRWDIYEPGWSERQWSYPPVPGVGGYIGSAAVWADGDFFDFDPDTGADPNRTISFPMRNLLRSTLWENFYLWFGKLANGTDIADGQYHVRFAILKPFGIPEAAEDWQVLSTPEIEIQRG